MSRSVKRAKMAASVLGRLVRISSQTTPILLRFSRNFSTTVGNQATRSRLLAPVISCKSCWRRWQSTDTTLADDRTKLREWVEKAKKGNWMSRWINDVHEIEKSLMSEEEYQEREKLIQQMTEMYFDNPSSKWDVSFFEKVFDTLIKFNDRIGAEIFLEMMNEMQVDAGEELLERVETYLKAAREASWFED